MQIPVAGEIWLPIPDAPGYEASTLGNIRSYRSANGRGGLLESHRPLKATRIPKKPYYQVTLGDGKGNYRQARLHILILETFKGRRPSPLHEGCHNDGNPENNAADNLRWGTKEDNTQDRLDHGRQIRGQQSPNTHLTEADVIQIRKELNEGVQGKDLAERFGVGTTTISRIKNRVSWRHVC